MKNTFKRIESIEKDNFCFEIHVTEMCNYSCSYCNLSPMNRHSNIDYNNMFKIKLPPESRVFLLGGEPTIDKYFFDIIDKCHEHDLNKIDIQTNMTFDVHKMISKLKDSPCDIKFYGSFHMEYSNISKFIDKCLQLKDAGMFGGVHLMWLHRLNDKCLLYYKMMCNVLDNISLEPTLPKSLDPVDWRDKQELKRFIELGHLDKCNRLSNKIKVDDTLTTIADALASNTEFDIFGKRCSASSNTIVYSVNKNRFYNCTFDLLYDRPFSVDQFNKGYCVCANRICCADLEFNKW